MRCSLRYGFSVALGPRALADEHGGRPPWPSPLREAARADWWSASRRPRPPRDAMENVLAGASAPACSSTSPIATAAGARDALRPPDRTDPRQAALLREEVGLTPEAVASGWRSVLEPSLPRHAARWPVRRRFTPRSCSPFRQRRTVAVSAAHRAKYLPLASAVCARPHALAGAGLYVSSLTSASPTITASRSGSGSRSGPRVPCVRHARRAGYGRGRPE